MMKRDQQHTIWVPFILLLLLFLGGGCQTTVIESELPRDVPEIWSFEHDIKQTPMSHGIVQYIDDAALVAYLEAVRANNPDLASIHHRLIAQEHRVGVSRAQLWPSLELEGSASKNNQTPNLSTGTIEKGSTYRLGAALAWEIDLWGKLNDTYQADISSLLASEWQYYAAKDSLIARAAQSWIRSASLKASLALAKVRVDTLEEILERVSARYSGGLGDVSELDAARTRLLLGNVELAEVQASYEQSLRVLNVFAGEYSEAELSFNPELTDVAFPEVLAPSEVLFNRPDIQIAMAEIEASLYQQRSARKRWFPSLTLSGNYGGESIRFDDLLDAQNAWDWALSVTKTLFDAGMERSERKAVEWESKAAVSELRSVVMNAVLEIHDVVAEERKLEQQSSYLQEASATALNNYEYQEKRYLEGLDPIVLMLNAKEEQLGIEAQLNELQAARLVNRIDTILALGYGDRE